MTSSVVRNFADLIQTLPALDDFPEASRESANKLNDVKLNMDMVQVFETYFIATMEEVERHKQIAHEAEILRAAQEQAAADEKERKEKGEEEMGDDNDGKTDGKTDGETDGNGLGKNTDGDFTPPKKKTKTKRKTTTPKKAAKPKIEVFKNPVMILDNQQKKNLGEFLLDVLPIEYVYSVMKLLGDCVLDNRRERENRLKKIVEREEKKKAKRKEKKDQTRMLEENLGIGAGDDDVGDKGDAGSTGKPGGPMPPPRAPTSIENPENPAPVQPKDADGEDVVTVTPMAAPADSNAMPPPEMTPGEQTDKNDLESKTENMNLNPDMKKPRKLIETPKAIAGVVPSNPDASFPDLDAIKKSDVPILQDLDDQQLLEEMMKLDSVRPMGPVIHGARKRKGSGGVGSRSSGRSRAKPVKYRDPESEDEFFSDEDSIDEFLTEIDTAGEEDDVGRLGQLLGGRKKKLRGKKELPEENERTDLHIKLRWNVQPQDFIHGFAISLQASRRNHRITWLGDPDYDPTNYKEKEDQYGNLIMIRRRKRERVRHPVHPSNPQNVFKCQICHKTFRTSKRMKLHVEAVHEGIKRFRCNYNGCDFRTAWSNPMKEHIIGEHGITKIYKCNFEGCPRAFKDKKSLRQHVRLHTGDKPYKCPYCEYAGSQKTCLNYHLKKYHNVIKQPRNLNQTVNKTTAGTNQQPQAANQQQVNNQQMNYGGNLNNMHDSGSSTPKYGSSAQNTGMNVGPVPPYRTQQEANAHLVSVTGNVNVMNPPPPRRQTGSKAPRQRVAGKSVNRQTASKNMPQQQFGNQLPTLAPEINQSPYYTNYNNSTSNNNLGQNLNSLANNLSNQNNAYQQVQQVAENALLQQLQQQQQLTTQQPMDRASGSNQVSVHMCYCPCHIYNDKTKCKCFCP